MWNGVYPAAVTHFKKDESLDIDATLAHLDQMIEAGIHGVIMLGTVGENCSLNYREKLELLKQTAKHVKGRIPVLSGVAECSTSLACHFAADAQSVGVNGLMVLPAMVYKSDSRETITHFRAVASSSDLPIMIYNNPVSYGVDITPEMFADMADEPKFAAIKESSENPRRITDIRNVCGDRYTLLCGVDDLVMETFILGAEGWVSGAGECLPTREPAAVGSAAGRRFRAGPRRLSVVHTAAAPRYSRQAGTIHQAGRRRVRLRFGIDARSALAARRRGTGAGSAKSSGRVSRTARHSRMRNGQTCLEPSTG